MTVGEWLALRTPVPPASLAACVRSAIGPRVGDDASTAGDACLRAAENLVGRLLADERTGRESAIDLLAADALVTYALEHVAGSAESIEPWATGAMKRIAAIGA